MQFYFSFPVMYNEYKILYVRLNSMFTLSYANLKLLRRDNISKSIDKIKGNKDILLHYILPGIGGMLGVSLYVLGDTMIVGRGLGAQGLTALNISIPMINFLNAFGLLFGIGASTLISNALGEKRYKAANRLFTKALLLSALVGLIITFFSLRYIDNLCLFLGASKDSFPMVKNYLNTFMSFSLPFILFSASTGLVRNDGGSRIVMIAMLLGSIFNVLFDYIFIFKYNLGMKGAALATGLAPCLGLFILSFHYIFRKNNLSILVDRFKVQKIKKIFATGTASFILELSSGIIIFAFNFIILTLDGDKGVSGYSIVANLSLIITSVFLGIAYGIQPLISYYNGAKNQEMINKIFKLSMRTAFLLSITFFAIGQLFPKNLAGLFITNNPDILEYTTPAIRLYFTAFLFMGFNIVWTMKFQARNNIKVSLFMSIFRGLVFLLISLFTLSYLFKMTGVWISLAFTEAISFIILLLISKRNKLVVSN